LPEKFEVMKNYYSGRYYWRLKDANSVIIVQGDGYTSKKNCLDAITLIKKVAPTAPIVDLATELITA
jgi:uncharacterized protein YegP (UPF0339 family)